LGDALAMKLTGVPLLVHSDFGQSAGELWAMEIDPSAAMVDFKEQLADDVTKLQTDDASSLTKELTALLIDFNDPPPGMDEVVTMTKVVSLLEEGYRLPNGATVHFDRIVLDTAPTGHTLRMLELPQFLHRTLRKVQSMHKKLSGLTSFFSMFSSSRSRANRSTSAYLDVVLQRLQTLQQKTQILERLLHDASLTEFAVVTIPTDVAMAETRRLVQSLHRSGIAVRRLLVNQVLPLQATTSEAFATKYVHDLRKGQQRILQELQTISEESKIPLVVLPSCEQEARTVPVLRDMANRLFPSSM
jgi:arsenite-transporting ATPase